MNTKIISAIAVAILLIILAVQNVAPVTLRVFKWEINGSLSLFLMLGILAGIIIGALFATLLWNNNKKEKPVQTEKDKTNPPTVAG